MKTHVELTRDHRLYAWDGDAPLIPEGTMITLPGIPATRVQILFIILNENGIAEQRITCGP